MSSRQAKLGSEQVVLQHQYEANLQEQANLLEAGSKMADTDLAMALSGLSSDIILSDVSAAVSAQASNLDSSSVTALLS